MGWFDRLRRSRTPLDVSAEDWADAFDRLGAMEYALTAGTPPVRRTPGFCGCQWCAASSDTVAVEGGLPQFIPPTMEAIARAIGAYLPTASPPDAAITSPRPEDVQEWGLVLLELREIAARLGRHMIDTPGLTTLSHTVELAIGRQPDRADMFRLTATREGGAVVVRANRGQGVLWSTDPFRPLGAGRHATPTEFRQAMHDGFGGGAVPESLVPLDTSPIMFAADPAYDGSVPLRFRYPELGLFWTRSTSRLIINDVSS